MTESIEAAVVGADTLLGEALLEQLRSAGGWNVQALAPAEAAGAASGSGEDEAVLGNVEDFDFAGVRVAFFAGPPALSARFAPVAADAGALAIDLSSHFRLDPEIPLVVPAVNPEELERGPARGIVACPDPRAIQLALVLHPLREAAGLERFSVVSLLGAAGYGRAAAEELGRQTADLLNFREIESVAYPRQIAFNLLPGPEEDDAALVREVHKILADERILSAVTSVQVPVFHGDSQAVQVQTRQALDEGQARTLLGLVPGIRLAGDPEPSPVTHASGNSELIVGKVRKDGSQPRGLALWLVADGHRLAAATAERCAAILVRDCL